MVGGARSGGVRRAASVGVAIALLAVLVLPSASAAVVTGASVPGAATVAVPAVSIHARGATWDGTNLSHASAQANAFTVTTNAKTTVVFRYFVPLGGPNVSVARMQAIYFGAVISTDQVSAATNVTGDGSATMQWSLGTFTYLLSGTYLLTASLVSSSGATLWSESFYIDATAAYHIASGLIVFLLVLGIVELVSIFTVGRSKRPKTGSAPPTPWEGSSTPPPAGSTPAAPAAEPPPAAPPEDGA